MGSTDRLAAWARPLLAGAGLELWDVELGPSVVRILVDRPEGVDLDALSAATAMLSPVLDERDDLVPAGRYDLEVSSPGLERTLRTPEQFRRYVGSVLSVKTSVPVDGARRMKGTLAGVGDDHIDLVVEGSDEDLRPVPLGQIERARTVLEWGLAPKAGMGNRGRAKPGTRTRSPRGEQDTPFRGPAPAGTSEGGPAGQHSRARRRGDLAEEVGAAANDKDPAP